ASLPQPRAVVTALDHSATRPVTCSGLAGKCWPGKDKTPADRGFAESGAGNETRTRDPNLGKVVLYQLSYSRVRRRSLRIAAALSIVAGRKCCVAASFNAASPAMLRADRRSPTTASTPQPRPAGSRQATAR